MIDLHTHILPALDDGVQVMDEAMELAEMAIEGGTKILTATPHSNQIGRFENFNSEELSASYRALRDRIQDNQMPLKLCLGMEIFVGENITEKIRNNYFIGINDSDYYLVEFPFDGDFYWISDRLQEILDTGKIPLIAHPERYYCVQDDPAIAFAWLQMGCRSQVNKGSLLGRFGRYAERTADILLDHDWITCVSSDAHSPYERTTYMGDIKNYLVKYLGGEKAYWLLEGNPERIIQNKRISEHGIYPEKKRRFFR